MSIDSSRAFRDYVTRVSFNLSMSRNQVATLRSVVLDIEGWDLSKPWHERHKGMDARRAEIKEARANGHHAADMYIPGLRYLLSTGLVRETEASVAARKADEDEKAKYGYLRNGARFWNVQPHELTEAGKHVVELLRLAGLIPMAAANSNQKRKRRA